MLYIIIIRQERKPARSKIMFKYGDKYENENGVTLEIEKKTENEMSTASVIPF